MRRGFMVWFEITKSPRARKTVRYNNHVASDQFRGAAGRSYGLARFADGRAPPRSRLSGGAPVEGGPAGSPPAPSNLLHRLHRLGEEVLEQVLDSVLQRRGR